ncbi:MAG: sugar ABC transporter ATP-binding protein [Anaerolineae bacterium]
MVGVSKGFPGVQALDNVDLEVHAREILGLVGENGAGKSTLMKILSGVYEMDSGKLFLEGKEVTITDPHQAQELGITIIYQEFNLMPNLTVAENVFIGREPNTAGFVRWDELQRQTKELTDKLGIDLPPTAVVRSLSVAQQQMVEIAKALSIKARIIIMDEPTSALTEREVAHLFSIMRTLKAQGLGIIFISHRIEEVFEIADRITVLRDGRYVGTVNTKETKIEQVIGMMVGRELSDLFQKSVISRDGKTVLRVEGISRTGTVRDPHATVLDNISFELHEGEILGLAGLVGAGRTELARAIFGADRRDSGRIYVDGKQVDIRSPRDAISCGMGFVPEDRKEQALFLALAVRENISLPSLPRLVRYGFVRLNEERDLVGNFVQALRIRTPSLEQLILNLSGGNQQKVVIAKWLALAPKILIMDEPTRGIDVGAKAEVHALMNQLANQGVGIIMISSELPEILGMSDRILVMREGRVAGELSRKEATPEKVMALATGVKLEKAVS